MKPDARIAIVILAAGGSVRMGRPKQLLEIEGEPLVARVADAALGSGCWPVVVVTGSHADLVRAALLRRPVLIAENPAWAEGMASSVRAGIATLRQFSRAIDAAIVSLCDQPGLTAGSFAELVKLYKENASPVVAARYGGHLGPPCLFAKERFPELERLTGEAGARGLVKEEPHVVAVDMPGLAHDLDTPEDYERLTRA